MHTHPPTQREKWGIWAAGKGDSMATGLLETEDDAVEEGGAAAPASGQEGEQKKTLWEPLLFLHSQPGFRRAHKLLTQSARFLAWLHRVTTAELEHTSRKRWAKTSYWMKASLPTQCNNLWLNQSFRRKFTLTTQPECRAILKTLTLDKPQLRTGRKPQSPL